MSNSPYVSYTKLSPHCTKPRQKKITNIIIHHMAGNLSVETCGNLFNGTRGVSSNYGIGSDGRIAMYVEEKNRAWTTANPVDHSSITIEVANNSGAPNWTVSDKAFDSLVKLCVDICKRNGIKELKYTGDKNGNLLEHRMFMATACPGPYLHSKMPELAKKVNEQLNPKIVVSTKPAQNKFLPSRGYFKKGDRSDNIAKIASFLRKNFPAYTPAAALGNYFGNNLYKSVKEFQRRTGLEADGNIGPKTLEKMVQYGFKY